MKVGTFAGIGVYLHFTFLLLLGLLAWIEYARTGSLLAALSSLGFLAALFFCLVLHEFGHALTAAKFKIGTKDITLLPIGGIARLERMPDKPWQEFLVAIMGPMVNVVIAAAIVGGMSAIYSWQEVRALVLPLNLMSGHFWLDLARVNILLVLFNMLPAFPMDGGRVLRAVLAMIFPYEKATAWAAVMGKAMAVFFFLEVLGFSTIPFVNGSGNPILALIAIFIWFGAGSEARYTMMKSRLKDIPVSRAMVTNFRTLSPRDTIEWAAELAAHGLQQDFPVADEGRVVGMLYQQDLALGAHRGDAYLKVADVMRKDVPSVVSSDQLEDVFARLLSSGYPIIPVTNRDLLVGLLPLERLTRVPPSGGKDVFRRSGQPATQE